MYCTSHIINIPNFNYLSARTCTSGHCFSIYSLFSETRNYVSIEKQTTKNGTCICILMHKSQHTVVLLLNKSLLQSNRDSIETFCFILKRILLCTNDVTEFEKIIQIRNKRKKRKYRCVILTNHIIIKSNNPAIACIDVYTYYFAKVFLRRLYNLCLVVTYHLENIYVVTDEKITPTMFIKIIRLFFAWYISIISKFYCLLTNSYWCQSQINNT